jgi:hypothetical protein
MCESDAIRLVRAARQGDAAAFAQLVSRHYPVLLRGAEPAELVALFYIAGLTRAEVAAELGTPARAVKTRLHKARRTLRASLHDTYEEYIAMPEPSPALIPMHVTGLRRAEPGKGHIVVLEDAAGRRLPIWIGAPEATAMALILEHVEMPRPGVHQFAAALLAGAGGTLAEVRITELTESVFYAQAILADGTRIDARPSARSPWPCSATRRSTSPPACSTRTHRASCSTRPRPPSTRPRVSLPRRRRGSARSGAPTSVPTADHGARGLRSFSGMVSGRADRSAGGLRWRR